ncbi:MAG: class I SAM-dependent methyltransferase [Anaerolineaceae bacterium]
MDFNPRFWHKRFTQQAGWTKEVRRYILQTLRATRTTPILEVGCGTGAVLSQIYQDGYHHVFGADIVLPGLEFARSRNPHLRMTCADGLQLPFRDARFSVSLCHYFLLWVSDSLAVLREMKRVTRSGGYVVVLAEPDYVTRQDEPFELRKVGELQNMALLSQGAHIDMGNHVKTLFEQLQLLDMHVSMLKPASIHPTPREDSLEWQVIAFDLQQLVDQGAISQEQLEDYRLLDERARLAGTRRLFIPTYFGWARVP